MSVVLEGHESDPTRWNSTHNCPVLRRRDTTISNRSYARLLRDALCHMADYEIRWEAFGVPIVIVSHADADHIVAQIEWRHIKNDFLITLTEVHFDRRTGAIHQAGSHYGGLEA